MFVLAILLGIVAYTFFLLGLFSLLQTTVVVATTLVFFVSSFLIYRKERVSLSVGKLRKVIKKHKTLTLLYTLLFVQGIVNLLGVLTPETAFDALWYHLTFPKLYLVYETISYIPGGLYYYATMPKLIELLYIPAINFGGDVAAKFVHFLFGIGICFVTYQIARLFLPKLYSILAVVLFYSSLVVAWESTTAYIDLGRTFFEALSVYALMLYVTKQQKLYLSLTGVMLGLAISAKLLALGSVLITVSVLVLFLTQQKKSLKEIFRTLIPVIFFSICIPLPWFIFGYISTGNPVFPFFTHYESDLSWSLLNPLRFISDTFQVFLFASDPLNPLYLVFVPLVIIYYRKFPKPIQLLCWYGLLSVVVWYLTPHTGGGRFILAYLPVYSVLVGAVLTYWSLQKSLQYISLLFFSLLVVCMVAFSTICYRIVALQPAISYLLGQQTKEEYLTNQLQYDFGDFYDIDGFFERTLKPGDTVLLYGFHNLYYLDFPFIHESFVKPGDTFRYIALQNGVLPKRFSDWNKIYYNETTGVSVYASENKTWVY